MPKKTRLDIMSSPQNFHLAVARPPYFHHNEPHELEEFRDQKLHCCSVPTESFGLRVFVSSSVPGSPRENDGANDDSY